MKKIIVLCILLTSLFFDSLAQTTKPKPVSKPAAAPVLKTLQDSASYAMGIFIVNFYRQQGITGFNSAMVARAINDIQYNKPRLLDDNQANSAVMNYINQKSKPNIEAGEKYLAANKKRPGVNTTASGLQYEIITTGTGPLPASTDSVSCNYSGTYIDGREFDNSYKTGKPVTFAVTGVITGWIEALQMMPVGSKWKLYVPYQLGYGASDYFSIPGGSALIFDLELVAIKGK